MKKEYEVKRRSWCVFCEDNNTGFEGGMPTYKPAVVFRAAAATTITLVSKVCSAITTAGKASTVAAAAAAAAATATATAAAAASATAKGAKPKNQSLSGTVTNRNPKRSRQG